MTSTSFGKSLFGLALLGAVALAVPAAAENYNGGNAFPTEASGAAQSPSARLTALIAPGGNLIRSKNVANVTNPAVGITCIRPTPGRGISVGRIVPAVSVEWGWSSGNDLVAYYFSNEPSFFTDCPAGYIEVRTYDFDGNPSDRVAFTIVVD